MPNVNTRWTPGRQRKVKAMVDRSNMAIFRVTPPLSHPDWAVCYRVERVTQGSGAGEHLHPVPRMYGFVGTGGMTWDWEGVDGRVRGSGAATRDQAALRLISESEVREVGA